MKYSISLLLLGAVLPLTSCIDDNYDLDNIETTARIEVDDLTLPLNLDAITLESILDLKDDEAIEVVDGQYAIVKTGDINPVKIDIPAVNIIAPEISPKEKEVVAETSMSKGRSAVDASAMRFSLSSSPETCKYTASNVSEYIMDVSSCECSVSIDLKLSLKGADHIVNGCDFNDVVLQIPKGLDLSTGEGESYNAETGEYYIDSRYAQDCKITLDIKANGVDFKNNSGFSYDYKNHAITFEDVIYVKSGYATITSSDVSGSLSDIPTTLTFRTEYELSDIDIKSFSGHIQYSLDEMNVPEINLSNIPDVLTQSGTDIILKNPCLYLNVNNPVQDYNLSAQTGLQLTAIRADKADKSFSLDNGQLIKIATDHANHSYNYCLSPEMPGVVDSEFSGATHVGFTQLSNLLSGDGIPTSINVDLIDPMIPNQQVEKFPVGKEVGEIKGKYKFVAPLNIAEGSIITYSDDVDGWNDEYVDKMTITTLKVTMVANTDIPVALDFKAWPIDVDGNQIGNVSIEGAKIDANANNQTVTVTITGEITHLDGLHYSAIAKAANGETLSPDMSISLKDVRVVVSGYYEKEL